MLFNLYLLTKVSRRKLFGTLRVVAYGTVVAAGLGALTIRSAVADAEDQTLKMGRQLADVADLLNGATEFRLNDQPIFFSTSTTNESVKSVLDRFEAHCNKSNAFSVLDWNSLVTATGKDLSLQSASGHFGVIRKEDDAVGDGMVMCFTGDNGPKNFITALRSFEASGDLHDLGDARYVHIQHRAKGPNLIQTMWTEGSFNIRTLIGTPGQDSVGSDYATLPRPIQSIRRFTAEAVHTPYSARIYESKAPLAAVLDDYKSKMERDGWVAVKSPYVHFDEGKDGRWFSRFETGEQSAVAVQRNGDVTMVVVGSAGVLDKAPMSLTRQ
jgi:hypothetical protein